MSGDRSPLQVRVWACPPGQRAEALRRILPYAHVGLAKDKGALRQLSTDVTYTEPQAPLGAAGEVADSLAEGAPGASWCIWQNPVPGKAGRIIMHTPDLGRFEGDCDARGRPVISRRELMDLTERCYPHELADALDTALGGPWLDSAGPALPGGVC